MNLKLIGSVLLILLLIIIPIYLTKTADKNRLQSLGLTLIGMGAMITYGSIFHKFFGPDVLVLALYGVVISTMSIEDNHKGKIILNGILIILLFVFSVYLSDSIKYMATFMGSQ